MIKPTVGRVVWFWDSLWPPEGAQPCAAIVCFVRSDARINIVWFSATGIPYTANDIELWQGEGERPTGKRFAEWMPYQKGQAAKTEALEATLKQGYTSLGSAA